LARLGEAEKLFLHSESGSVLMALMERTDSQSADGTLIEPASRVLNFLTPVLDREQIALNVCALAQRPTCSDDFAIKVVHAFHARQNEKASEVCVDRIERTKI